MKRLVSAIVLAGGRSQRIGADKALLEFDGQPLIRRVLEPLQRLSNDVIIVAKDAEPYAHLGARTVSDGSTEQAPLIGLQAGLRAARHRLALAVACDMPFLDDRLLRFMIVASKAYDAVVPRMGGLPEPLHAAYRVKPCLAAVEASLKRGELKMTSFLPQLEVRYVDDDELDLFDPQRLSFFNVNTREDWERGQMLAQRLRQPPANGNGEAS